MNYKAVIFDLDGTLVNSLEDIADAMNTVLKNSHYPTHDYAAYNYFIGHGLLNLVSKAIPQQHNTATEVNRCFEELMTVYSENCVNKTKAYEGVNELLDTLKEKEITLAILSNKADVLTKKVVQKLFPDYFKIVIGLTTEELKKPNPATAIQISTDLNIPVSQILYVGDSGVDMQTATNANMHAVGVSWGFRPVTELQENGAKTIINTPLELLELL